MPPKLTTFWWWLFPVPSGDLTLYKPPGSHLQAWLLASRLGRGSGEILALRSSGTRETEGASQERGPEWGIPAPATAAHPSACCGPDSARHCGFDLTGKDLVWRQVIAKRWGEDEEEVVARTEALCPALPESGMDVSATCAHGGGR